ncbi:hypothetical protein EXIGLDRAFT_732888 [Exidia glandulosa HHB12029]|uniref:Protein kinase domain-containing protein n=1 Tax=Exidia glandulosa HHB12029 TaxID=1314781 RepID=A0A165PT60_EXIGL|nr:hypothetical protein EXIGLDRAFT_732888 [Exidia glandulosa HHB12029]
MPLLAPVETDRLHTHASAFECARQIINGVAFLHSLGIAHGDIHISNLLMSHSGPPFKIYFIDFDLAHIDPDRTCMVVCQWKGGKIQPPEVDEEFSQRKPYNPFLADIFALGVTWQHFQLTPPCPYMQELRYTMMEDDPASRPTAQQCATAFGTLYADIPKTSIFSPTLCTRYLWRVAVRGRNRKMWFRELAEYLVELCILFFRGVEYRPS